MRGCSMNGNGNFKIDWFNNDNGMVFFCVSIMIGWLCLDLFSLKF